MRGDKQDGDIGPHTDMRDTNQMCKCQVERRRCLDTRDTIALRESLSLGPCRQIDGWNAQGDFWLHDLKGCSVDVDKRGPQRFVPLDNVSERFFDQVRRQLAFDAPAHRYVQRGIARLELVERPEAVLRQGGRILNVAPHFDQGRYVRLFRLRGNVDIIQSERQGRIHVALRPFAPSGTRRRSESGRDTGVADGLSPSVASSAATAATVRWSSNCRALRRIPLRLARAAIWNKWIESAPRENRSLSRLT